MRPYYFLFIPGLYTMLRPWNFSLKIVESDWGLPLYLQISNAIIKAIKSGNLQKGELLPGTRTLALSLKVSRNTVIEAYSFLEQKDWIFSVPKGGTFVSYKLPEDLINLVEIYYELPKSVIFDQGLPDNKHSPIMDIMREYRRIVSKIHKGKMIMQSNSLGYEPLRIKLAQILNHQRRIHANPNNICITRGSQMAIFLLSQSLLKQGDCIIVEHPGYQLAWDAFKYAGAEIIIVETDKDGILIAEIKKILKIGKKIKAIYITPNSQFPTTVMLSELRRQEIIKLSNKHDFFIIEDDYCIDLNYENKTVFPLCCDNQLNNYIYIGTFSRSVSPLIKIGYLVSNHSIIEKIGTLRGMIDITGDTLMEAAFFNLIQDNTFNKHIKKYTAFYRDKRDNVDILLKKYLKNKVKYQKPQLGLGYWIVPLNNSQYNVNLIEDLRKRGVEIISSDYYKIKGNGFYLSFGSADMSQLEAGIKIIAEYL